MGGKSDEVEKQDMAWRLIGAVVGLGVGFAARKAIEYGWRKTTGKQPPADPNSLETSLAEAIGFAVVMGVGMEVTRIVATRTAHKRYQAWKGVSRKAERVVGV
jgi:hypothetical protein